MRLVKPIWMNHDDSPIFSVDLHPDGKRLATGGQGEGDTGRVVIWNIEPVFNEEAELDEKIPKLLCQLDHHLACVNCVRWNKSGLLASGSDDKLIKIWKLAVGVGGTSVFGGKAGVETWRCIATLRGHDGDILDLAWAPFSFWLASASVDNTVIIWNTQKYHPYRILRGHTGLVKGVAWDPLEKYVASQSDDKSLRVWRVGSDWGEEAVITEPFEECGGTTHVLRLSWSPDGQYLVSAHAMNGGGPTAQIIEREGWKPDKDFVGHRKAITCVRFNGHILKKTVGKSKGLFCCAAVGSRDRSLSVWSTCLQRPLVVVHDLFTHSILDISWSVCGARLCACSKDGTVAFIEFVDNELGQPVDIAEHNNILERMYGKLQTEKLQIIETPELLSVIQKKNVQEPAKPQQTKEADNLTLDSTKTASITSLATTPSKAPINKQIETRTTDGKRRITPMFIPPPPEAMDTSTNKPIPTVTPSTFSSSSQSKSSIVIEKRDEVVNPNIRLNLNTSSTSYSFKNNHDGVPKSNRQSNHDPPSPAKNSHVPSGKTNEIFLTPLQPKQKMCQMGSDYTISIANDQGLSYLEAACTDTKELLWNTYLGYNAVAISMTPQIVAIALEDGSVHIMDTETGCRPVPPLVPPSPLAKLCTDENNVMTVSCQGDIRVWEIGAKSRVIASTSAAHLLTPGTQILLCLLFNGMPMIAFTNSRAYIYQNKMEAWVLVGDSQDPVLRWSSQSAYNSTILEKPKGPLGILQRALDMTAGLPPTYPKLPHSAACILAYLEHQVTVSKAIGSKDEYNCWLLSYAQFLITHEGLERKLRLVLNELLGPSHSMAMYSKWDPLILGLNKHTILEEILGSMREHLHLQRVYMEYKEQLDDLKKMPGYNDRMATES